MDILDAFMSGAEFTEKLKEETPKNKEETKKVKMYDVQNSILKKDFIPNDEEMGMLNSFLLCRWLSNHAAGIKVAEYLNKHYDMPIEAQYWFARDNTFGIKYINFPKKVETDAVTLKKITAVCSEYKCNTSLAKRYISILPEENIERLLKKWTSKGRQ